ncbi:hypothetical protein TNCV_3273351 [Trichonephila clavipes]|nr:hypothetical protein TNCV_3273351 [Trichonephila clavipes]
MGPIHQASRIIPGLSSGHKLLNFCKFNLNPISRVVIRRFASTNAFIASLSASTGLPERGASSTSKLPDRNLANQLWRWHTYNTPSPYTSVNSFWLEQYFYPFCSKTVRYVENAAYRSPYLKGHQPKTTA